MKKGKRKSSVVASMEVDEFAMRFEQEFSLVTCLSSLMSNNVWYIH